MQQLDSFPQVRFFKVDLDEVEVRRRRSPSPASAAPPGPPARTLPAAVWALDSRRLPALLLYMFRFETALALKQELGELLEVRTLPTFVLLKAGAEVHRLEGAPQQRPARKLALALRTHLLGEESGSGGSGTENEA